MEKWGAAEVQRCSFVRKAVAGLSLAAESYDYVIVGGGTCGLVLANRLSQDPTTTVAVIDPGPDTRSNPLVREPAPSLPLFRSLLTNWDYRTVPQPNTSGRSLEIHSGRGLGGSSLINGMAYVRGDKAQFDAWEELGNPGWNWDELFPYFKKVEKMFSPEPWQVNLGASIRPENHGFGGELHVGYAITRQNTSFYTALQQSWAELGQPANDDVNGGSTRGFEVCPQTLDPELNQRWDAASAFLWPVAHRPNLHLINGTAARVVWANSDQSTHIRDNNDAVASGVEYVTSDNEVRTALASREVILSAGTFRTPLILERSGVGNPRLLKEVGIEPVVDLPGVGENLVDQSNVPIMFKTGKSLHGGPPYVSFATAADLFGANTSQLAFESRRSLGHWARQVAKSNPGLPDAAAIERIFRIQHDLIFNKGVTLAEIFTTTYAGTVVSTAANLLPFSRGSIHLHHNSTVPAIDPKYLSVDIDMVSQIAAGRLASRLANTPPLSDLAVGGLLPPEDTDDSLPPPATDADDEAWQKWTADAISSNWHSMGTAAMMARELGGVVDPRLAVYGTRRLRVVDASIMPTQLSGHPMATLYAIADRAADMIKSDASSSPSTGNGPDYREL
ncbi:glucose oxidase [Xylaria curta]|nr:glucose oxidase [Xylaria curta]